MKPLQMAIRGLSLLSLASTVAIAASSENGGGGGDFQPPKLSFTLNSHGNIVGGNNNGITTLSDSDHDDHDGMIINGASSVAPWTVFQGVSAGGEDGASVKRRTGPLLSLFLHDNNNNNNNGNGNDNNMRHSHAKHVVATPSDQRAYLVQHGKECYSNTLTNDNTVSTADNNVNNVVLDRFDLLSASPTTAALSMELWKYCALYAEGGVYVDAETAPLLALGDVLNWSADGNGSRGGNRNYAVLANDGDAGVSPSLFDDNNVSASSDTGNGIVTGALLAIPTKHHPVPHGMVEQLLTQTVQDLEEHVLLLPKALKELIRKDQLVSANHDDNNNNIEEDGQQQQQQQLSHEWEFFTQRCQGVEVAGGEDGENEYRLIRHCPASIGYCCEIVDPHRGFVFLLSRHSILPNQLLPHHSDLPQPYSKNVAATTTNYNANTNNANSQQLKQEDNNIPLDRETTAELAFLSTIHPLQSHQVDKHFSPGTSQTTPNAYEILSSLSALPAKQTCLDCLREKNGADCKNCGKHCGKFCDNLCSVEVKEKPVSKVMVVKGPRYRKDPERLIPRIIHQTWFEPVTPEKYPNMARLIESWKRSGWDYRFYDDASAAEFLSLHFPPEVREAYDSIIPGAFKADLFRYCVLLIKGGIYSDMDVMLESNLDAAVPPDVGFMTPVDAPGSKPDHRMCLWNGFIASAPAHPFLARAIEHVVNNIRNRFTVVDYDQMMCPSPELSVPHAFSTLFTAGPCILGFTLNEVMGRDLQTSFVEGDLVSLNADVEVPGRTIILQQNKWDMGAHRFTWMENNLVVAATDMPDYDDRQDLEGDEKEQTNHYSKTQTRSDLYGLDKVYVNRNIAHERIVIKTEAQNNAISSAE